MTQEHRSLEIQGSLTAFFYEEIHEAQGRAGAELSEEIEAYVVHLLADFVRRTGVAGRRSPPLALQFMHASGQTGSARAFALRRVGDRALFISGAVPRSLDPLELEAQAEVDKLALCLFDRRPAAASHYDALVDRLFYRFTLASDLSPALQDRYEAANRLALGFAKRLDRDVRAGRWDGLRRRLQRFWGATLGAKRGLARAS